MRSHAVCCHESFFPMRSFLRVRVGALLLLVGVLGPFPALAQEKPEELYQSALYKEEVEGDLQAAIQIYRSIVRDFAQHRQVAAKALVRIGESYEKLGMAEARAAYRRVIQEYTDQRAQVAVARARLTALELPAQQRLARASAATESGMMIRRVWTHPESRFDVTGTVSADGRYLTFEDLVTGDLLVRDLTAGTNRHLTHNEVPRAYDVGNALLSPDGRQVAYNWDNNVDRTTDLRIIGLDGSEPRVLYSHEEVTNIDVDGWSPDGTSLLVRLDRKDRTRQLAWVSVADGSVRVLKTLDWDFYPRARLSPDGRFIAYDFAEGPESDDHSIRLLAADGSRETPLFEEPGDDHVLGWTPDGKSLLFRSERMGTEDAWLIRIDDGRPQGRPQIVKREIGHPGPRGITRDGAFYYTLSVDVFDVHTAALDPLTGNVLASPKPVSQRFGGRTLGSDWSPDGKYLAYYVRSPRSPVRIRSVETGEERTLSPKNVVFGRFRGGALPRWSPDGRSLLVRGQDRREPDRHALYRVDARTGETIHILTLPRGVYFGIVGWSRDGTAVFFGRFDSSTQGSQIVWRDLETGKERELYEGAFAPALSLSPDGERLAFRGGPAGTSRGPIAVMTVPVTGGEPRTIINISEPGTLISGVAWTPDGGHLLFLKRHEPKRGNGRAKSQLWRVPAEGGEPQRLQLTIDGSAWDLHAHPDGRRISFTASKQVDELWVMENFLPAPEGGNE